MADKVGILINTILNAKPEDLQKQLDSITKKVKINLKPRIDFDENVIAKFKADIDKLAKNIKVNLQSNINKQSVKDAEKTVTETAKKISEKSKSQNAKIKVFDKEQLEAEGRQFFISATGIVNRVKNQFKDLGDVNVNFLKNAKNQVVGFEAEIKKLDGTIEKLRFDMAKIKVGDSTQKGFVFSGANLIDKNAGDILQKNLNTLQKFETRLKNIRDRFTSSRGVKDVANLNILNKEYNSILSTIEKLRKSQLNLTEEQKRNIDKQINTLQSLYKTYRDIEITAEKGFNFKQFENITGQLIKLRQNLDAQVVSLKNYKEALSLPLLQGYRINRLSGVQETKEYLKLTQELQKGNQFVELTAYIDKATGSIYKYSHSARNAMIDTLTWSKAITTAFKRVIQWMSSTTLIFGSIRAFKDMLNVIKEVDNALVDINKVLDLSNESLKEFAKNATIVGEEYGRTTVEVLNATAAFAKAGLNKDTAQNFAKLALLLANVGDMTIESAQETLIAANAGYQLGNSYQSLLSIIDKFNEIANQNATEVSQLAEAWKVSAATAKQAGLSIDEYTALVGTAQSVTQRSGAEIGNAWRTILMRIQGVSDGVDTLEEDVSKAEQALNSIGIAVRKSPNEFRPAMEVLEELATKFNNLSSVEQSYVTEALAGKYRANILKSTLQNFDMIYKQISEAMNSAGSAIKENERYMDSITAKSKQLIAVWEQLSQTVINSDWVKGALDLLIAGTETIDNVISQIGLLNTALLIVISTLTILRGKAIFDWITSLGSLFLEATKSVGVFSAAMQVASASTVGLKTALLGLLTNPVALTIAAVGVIVGGIALWSNHQQKLREELEISKKVQEEYNATLNVTSKSYNELYESAVQSRKQIDANTASLMGSVGVAEKLIDRLEELATKENKSTFEKQQMKQIVDKLNESIPNLNLIIDETTGKLNQETSAVKNAIGAYKELLFVRAAEEKAKAAAARAYEAQLNIDKEKEKASKITYTKNGTPIFYSANENYNEVVRQNQKIIDEANKEIEQSFKMAEEYAKKYGNIEKNINNSVTKGTNFIPKSSDSSSESKSTTEIYEVEINQFQQLEDALAKVNDEIERNQALTDIAEDKDKINLLSQRIELLKQEQQALHNIAEARRTAISQNVSKLSNMGFDVSYDPATNNLVVRNMERLNQIKGKDVETTNELRKEYEELIKETISLNDANRQAGNQWWHVEKQIKDIPEKIKQIREAQQNLADDLITSYQNYLLKTIDSEIEHLEDLKRQAQETAQSKIDKIQEEIDKLRERNDELKEEEERQKRLQDLARQRELVENIQKEKNVRLIGASGEDIWIADPKKLKEETDKLKEMQEDYNKWEEENSRQAQIKKLENQIKEIRETLKNEETSYDDRIKKLRDFTKKQQIEIEKQNQKITSYQQLIQNLVKLEKSTYDKRLAQLQEFVTEYNKAIAGMKGMQSVDMNFYSSSSDYTIGKGSAVAGSKEEKENLERIANDKEFVQSEIERAKSVIQYRESQGLDTSAQRDYLDYLEKNKYADGGETQYTGLHWLDGKPGKPERVLSAEQTRAFNRLVDHIVKIPEFRTPTNSSLLRTIQPVCKPINNQPIQYIYQISKLEFPNVKNGDEVVETLKNLPRIAIQYAR